MTLRFLLNGTKFNCSRNTGTPLKFKHGQRIILCLVKEEYAIFIYSIRVILL